MKRLIVCFGVVTLFFVDAGQSDAGGLDYQASQGTLPQAQGFNFVDSGGSPTPSVSGGVLYQGLTSDVGLQYWYSTAYTGSFSNGFTMEAVVDVVSSTQNTSTRFGYYLDAGDSLGREFSIGISSTGVAVNTDGTGSINEGIPLTPFNTSGFHDYKLVVSGGIGSLYIDGNFINSTPVRNNDVDTPNKVFFGDGTENGQSQTELKSFSYSFNSVPEPGSMTLYCLGLVCFGGMRWSRVRKTTVAA